MSSDNLPPQMNIGENPITIVGPVGQIEGILTLPADYKADDVMVICHPHPLEKGTMHNKVVHTLAKTFSSLGMPCFRFNFRGVGKSEGGHDHAIGEREDLKAVVAYALEMFPKANLRLAGFSFGSAISAAVANELGAISLTSIAPPVVRWGFEDIDMPVCDWLIVQGEADEVIDAEDVFDFAQSQVIQPKVIRFEDTSHFFHGKLVQLKDALLEYYG